MLSLNCVDFIASNLINNLPQWDQKLKAQYYWQTPFYLIKALFGGGPLGRILAVIGSILSGVFYAGLFSWASFEAESMILALIILFGPIGLVLLMLLLNYAFAGQKNKE